MHNVFLFTVHLLQTAVSSLKKRKKNKSKVYFCNIFKDLHFLEENMSWGLSATDGGRWKVVKAALSLKPAI